MIWRQPYCFDAAARGFDRPLSDRRILFVCLFVCLSEARICISSASSLRKSRVALKSQSQSIEVKTNKSLGLSLSHSSEISWRRRTIFTSMDASREGGSIDVKIVCLRPGNPEERRGNRLPTSERFPSFPRDSRRRVYRRKNRSSPPRESRGMGQREPTRDVEFGRAQSTVNVEFGQPIWLAPLR